MRTLRFDSTGGASGDMILAALIDLGVGVSELQACIDSLSVGPCEIRAAAETRDGFRGTTVDVHIEHEPHTHRNLSDIRQILESSTQIQPEAVQLALRVFARLADAEASVHGTTPDKIHFHEVGALDSITDITAACVALHKLGVERVCVGPLPVGQGSTKGAHGVMPIPVPATVELLTGHELVQTAEQYELITPTGAALLSTWKAEFPCPAGARATPKATGVGFGKRKLAGRPNMLRVTLLEETNEGADAPPHDCLVIECNLDDCLPEWIGSAIDQLFEAGALDVFTTPVQMKKHRPGTRLTVLADPSDREALLDIVFRETTTFGVREYKVTRNCLERRYAEVATQYGPVRVKIGRRNGQDVTISPEHEECARAARKHGVGVRAVYREALAAAREIQS